MTTPASFAETNQRIPLSSQDEYDWLTGWRHVLKKTHQSRKQVKRKYNRRWRKQTRSWAKSWLVHV